MSCFCDVDFEDDFVVVEGVRFERVFGVKWDRNELEWVGRMRGRWDDASESIPVVVAKEVLSGGIVVVARELGGGFVRWEEGGKVAIGRGWAMLESANVASTERETFPSPRLIEFSCCSASPSSDSVAPEAESKSPSDSVESVRFVSLVIRTRSIGFGRETDSPPCIAGFSARDDPTPSSRSLLIAVAHFRFRQDGEKIRKQKMHFIFSDRRPVDSPER